MLTKLAEYKKTLIALVGAVIVVLNEVLPILPAEYQNYVTAIIAVAVALGVYQVPNTTDDPSRAVGRSVVLKANRHEAA